MSSKTMPGSLQMQGDKSTGSRWRLPRGPLRGDGLQGALGGTWASELHGGGKVVGRGREHDMKGRGQEGLLDG